MLAYIKWMKVFGCLCVLACKSGHLFSNQILGEFLLGIGPQGTHFFMVMTGFLHPVSLFREQAAISSHMINQVRLESTFILRRLLRIYPAYALTVLVTQVIYKDPSREFHLMNCLSLSSRITSHVWFLRVELLYYVLVLVPLKVTIRMITQFFKGFKDVNSGQKAAVLIMASLCAHSIVQWGQPFFQHMEGSDEQTFFNFLHVYALGTYIAIFNIHSTLSSMNFQKEFSIHSVNVNP